MNAPSPSHHKVRADHLQRDAYLYVRQSSMRQVLENTESTKRKRPVNPPTRMCADG